MRMRHSTTFAMRRGFTLTEALVAITIALVFLGSVLTAYVQISHAADNAEAQVSAHTRARVAVDTVLRDLAQVRTDPTLADQDFILISNSLTFGDGIDNDGDSTNDEEVFDGVDNDSDFQQTDDNHATIGTFTERPEYVGAPDLGDFHVDEDCVFARDVLIFRIPAEPSTSTPPRRITYRLDSFDGQDNVLIRRVVTDPGGPAETTEETPVVFDVVSFDVLAMNANDDISSIANPPRPYWQQTWNASTIQFPTQQPIGAPFGTPPFEFPSAMLVRVTTSAESLPLADIQGWPLGSRSLNTVGLQSVVPIEEVIDSAVYTNFVRRP